MQNRSGLHEAHRLYGKALDIRSTFSVFSLMQKRSGLHETQPLARQRSCCPLHIMLVPPAAKPEWSARKPTACTATLWPSAAHQARSARRKTEADCTQTNRLYGKALLSAAHQARSARRKAEAAARSSTACTAKLSPSAAHSARSTRCETEAVCVKINRLYGKASRWPMLSSAFRPLHNRSGLHEAQPLVRQGLLLAAAHSACSA